MLDTKSHFNKNGLGPLRVWFRNEERPGLAMTRSMGDHLARPIGVISTPEIYESREMEDVDFGIVIASDGVFEVLSNQKIANI
jgi:serine/threonine protein phosphatase PrpC